MGAGFRVRTRLIPTVITLDCKMSSILAGFFFVLGNPGRFPDGENTKHGPQIFAYNPAGAWSSPIPLPAEQPRRS